jgi:hypothetical protein
MQQHVARRRNLRFHRSSQSGWEHFIESEPNEVSVNNRGQTASLPPEAFFEISFGLCVPGYHVLKTVNAFITGRF